MTKLADLHIHTYYSDGTFSPLQVIDEAHKHGISCIAVTDHDTIEGVRATKELGAQCGIEVISGVELSSEINGKDVHILGYLFDETNETFLKQLIGMQKERLVRIKGMIAKLKELGVADIAFEEVCALAKSDSIGRPHLATVLVQKGIVANFREAFNKYLAEGAPAYVSKFKQTPQEAIMNIKNAGGVAVLAHPMFTQVDERIPEFVRAGMEGIEVYYPNVSKNTITFYENQAKKHHLIPTGGSDAHGEAKVHTFIGKVKVPYSCVEKLKTLVKK